MSPERWCRGGVGVLGLLAVLRAVSQPETWRYGVCAAHVDATDRIWVVAVGLACAACQLAIPGPGQRVRAMGWLVLAASMVAVDDASGPRWWTLHNWLLRGGALAVLVGTYADTPDARGVQAVGVLGLVAAVAYFAAPPTVSTPLALAAAVGLSAESLHAATTAA